MPAAIDTYPKLLAAIEEVLARNDLRVDIQGWVWLAEIQIQRVLRINPTEKKSTGLSFTDGQSYVAPPADFLVGRYIEIQTNPLRYVTPAAFDKITAVRQNVTDGIPRLFTVHGGNIELGPVPGAGLTFDFYYIGGLPHLSNSNTTGWLLDKGADALLYSALLNSSPFLGEDDRFPLWQTLANGAISAIDLLAWNEKIGGGPLQRRPDVYA